MLVRSRRLVFSERANGSSYRNCQTSIGDYCVSRVIGEQRWNAKRNGSHLCDAVDSEDEAIGVCQRDFDAHWIAETEVMPLEWKEAKCEGFVTSLNADSPLGLYRVFSDSSYWRQTDAEAWIQIAANDSRDHGKQLCNEHHRKLVLG